MYHHLNINFMPNAYNNCANLVNLKNLNCMAAQIPSMTRCFLVECKVYSHIALRKEVQLPEHRG